MIFFVTVYSKEMESGNTPWMIAIFSEKQYYWLMEIISSPIRFRKEFRSKLASTLYFDYIFCGCFINITLLFK